MPPRQRPPSPARALIPDNPDLDALRAAAARCTACDLYRNATQTVFGEGTTDTEVMLVGEQPGDAEDRAGRPSMSSRSPGCSPTSITSAFASPSPNTVCVPVLWRSQARHPWTASRSASSVSSSGR